MNMQEKDIGGIIYSSYVEENRSGEQFIAEHVAALILSGRLTIIDGSKTLTFNGGDMVLFRKNNLAKFIKQPLQEGRFTAVAVILDKDTLLNFSKEQHSATDGYLPQGAALRIGADDLLQRYFDSLMPYFEQHIKADLIHHKIQELILLLLRSQPDLKNVLFDFGMPGKIDLEAFMNRNFRYNVTLEKLAFLTGRSLATFKRDFEKTFHCPPGRWLQEQRLKEAHYLISEKKLRPSDVYLEVGFESLSHFSHAFKKSYGTPPSEMAARVAAEPV
jgi:AraC-like DNA-binding protein